MAGNVGTRPSLTRPQIYAFVAFAIYAVLALISSAVTEQELEQAGKLTMFLIGALLPSDALIRFGRNLLFQKVDDPDKAAKYAPATTTAQTFAFATWGIVVLMALLPGVSEREFTQIADVARVLIIALLPSDAGIRFGRALYFRSDSTPQPGRQQLQRV